MRGRRPNPDRAAWFRRPAGVHPVGKLSDFGQTVEVARRVSADRCSNSDRNDPTVYIACGIRGRKTPADLFYLIPHPVRSQGSLRVYIREVVGNG